LTVRSTVIRLSLAALLALVPLSWPLPSAWGQEPAAIEIVPHRAIYKMTLQSARSGSSISDVRGQMMFEWADACDAWTIEQRFKLEFLYTEGDQVKMNTSYVTWEAKDGNRYRYNVRKLVNGQADEEIKGTAEVDGTKGGSARYAAPEEQAQELPPGTLFPTRHTIELLQQAQAGEKLMSRPVFDGADADGLTEVNAVIGEPTQVKDPGLNRALLAGQTAWPVRLAFFPAKSKSAAPDYEMTLLLLRNGIAQSMRIDYGDFTVNAVLETLEALPKPPC